MTAAELDQIRAKFRDGSISEEERQLLKEDILKQLEINGSQHTSWTPEKEEQILASILEAIHEKPKAKIIGIKKYWWAAASAIIILFSGTYFFFSKKKPENVITQSQEKRFKNDVAPGGNKAILTLGNGSTIVLDSAGNGQLAIQGSTRITKTDSGKLAYNNISAGKQKEVVFNTLSTPKGGHFQLTLPDGSMVWLNAASSITYPTSFSGNDRKVIITGEVYFEVVHNAKHPFSVLANGIEVQDIGTHFNINAYTEEKNIKATLLEGAVSVSTATDARQLLPNEQALVDEGNISIRKDPDIEKTMAWKNNLFIFSGDDIQSIMRQLSRWYNVKVYYQGNLENRHFSGIISRNNNISQVLKLLESTEKVKFIVNQNNITVIP